jgi:hypothetical protein
MNEKTMRTVVIGVAAILLIIAIGAAVRGR